jgi:hypothetical protein
VSDIRIGGVLRSGRFFWLVLHLQKCDASPLLNGKIAWFTTRQEFNERSRIALFSEFLGNGGTNH